MLDYGRMIKFSHSIFALPFALTAVVLAAKYHTLTISSIIWILAAMVGARSAAMGFNRIVDSDIDARNPRTSSREIPAGRLSKKAAVIFVLISSGLFILAAAMLNKLCFFFSFPVLAVLFFYSYTKRFTTLSHFYLGFSISLAPVGAWIAVTGTLDLRAMVISLALMTYIAGFDILYSCQDIEFDRREGLFSLPARIGPKAAMLIARFIHLLSYGFFISLYFLFDLGVIYLCGLFIIGALYIVEHQLVKPRDLTHINLAFFHVNSLISMVLFFSVLLDECLGRPLW